MRSSLYRGSVVHTRTSPFRHRLSYRVFYGLFDVDELDELDRTLRWFSVDRFNLLGFHRRDHGPADGSSLRGWAERLLAAAGVDLEGGRIQILSLPRVLGYVFDPISVWYCHGPEGELRGILHDVRNTFGHRHTYVVPVSDESDLRHRSAKRLHVSPFNDMDEAYDFTVSLPGRRLTVGIAESDASGQVFLRAGLRLSRLPLSDRNLLRLFFTHPLLTLKVIAGIHWEALKIWLKGGRFRRVPPPPSHDFSVVEPSEMVE